VSVGGLLGAAKLGPCFGKKSAFYGVECAVPHRYVSCDVLGASGWVEVPFFLTGLDNS